MAENDDRPPTRDEKLAELMAQRLIALKASESGRVEDIERLDAIDAEIQSLKG